MVGEVIIPGTWDGEGESYNMVDEVIIKDLGWIK